MPSGATVRSSLLISSGVRGRPRLGCCASHKGANRKSAAADNRISNLDIDMLHRPIPFDTPALNTVEVIELARRILGAPGRPGGLHFALFISGPAHQDRRLAIPLPRKAKASERLR